MCSRCDRPASELIQIGDGLYAKADADKLHNWVELVASLLLYDHSTVEDLKSATRALGAKAQAQYPQLQSGEQDASLDVADAAPFLDPFPTDLHLGIVVITGEVLWSCIDGPNAGAVVLCDALDEMHTAMTTKGGD